MHVDRRRFIAAVGGAAAVAAMGHEDRAEALEHYMTDRLDSTQRRSQSPRCLDLVATGGYSTRRSSRGSPDYAAKREMNTWNLQYWKCLGFTLAQCGSYIC